MSPAIVVDLVVVVALVLAAWRGGRTGAARSIVSLVALALGLVISAQGQEAAVSFVAKLLPEVDVRLVGFAIFLGGIWLILALASYLVGRILQAALRAIHLGPVDSAIGALFGLLQAAAVVAVVVFVLDAAASVGFVLPAPLGGAAAAVTEAQSAQLIRSLVYPLASHLVGGLLPEGLRALLVP